MRRPSSKMLALTIAGAWFLFSGTLARGQHSDIEIGYRDGKIAIDDNGEGLAFGGEFANAGAFEQFTSNPGFATNASNGLLANSLDFIDYNILGPLAYHDGSDFAPVPAGADITIGDNPGGIGLLVVDAQTVGPVSGPGVIGRASDMGGVHDHIDFELNPRSLGAPEYGAYGLLMELTTDEPGIMNSDPFFIVFNFGMEESRFDQSLAEFAALVPEPASLPITAMVIFVAAGLLNRRRLSRHGQQSESFISAQVRQV